MALSDIPAAIGTAFEALGGPYTRSRSLSDYRDDVEGIAEGTTKYQIRAAVVGRNTENSNETRSNLQVELIVTHHLPETFGVHLDGLYQRDVMLSDTRSLLDPAWWRAIAGILSLSEVSFEVERVGNLMVYTVTAQLVIAF